MDQDKKVQLMKEVILASLEDKDFLPDLMRIYILVRDDQEKENNKKLSDLGFLAGFMIQKHPKTARKFKENLVNMLKTLKWFFQTAPFEKTIDNILKEN